MVYVRKQDKQKSILNQNAGRQKSLGTIVCPYCNETVFKYSPKQNICTKKQCISRRNRDRIQNFKISDPIRYKATTLSGSVRLGKGKIEIMLNLINSYINRPCIFCGVMLTDKNISLDHKEPIHHTTLYDRKNKKSLKTYEELRYLHRPENLQIICSDCNQIKGDLNNDNYIKLCNFLNSEPEIKNYVRKKIKASRVYFSRNR